MKFKNFYRSLQPASKHLFKLSSTSTLLGGGIVTSSILFTKNIELHGVGLLVGAIAFISAIISLLAFINFTRLKSFFNLLFIVFFLVNVFLVYLAYKALTVQTPF